MLSGLAPGRRPDRFRRVPFPAEVILVAVRWYLRYGLSYRDVEELLAERGIEVDHVTIYRWELVRRQPLTAVADRPRREVGASVSHRIAGRLAGGTACTARQEGAGG
jgi:transposase-like protein